jgi:general secretion pathway protein J
LKRSTRTGPAGTTLIELLVALSLLALIAVLLLGGMRLGLRVWDSGGDRQVFEQRLERTDAFLRQLLGQAGRAAPPVSTPGADAIAAPTPPIVKAGFLGEADRLHFIALLPYQLGSAGKYEFELARHSSAEGGNLVLGWRRNIGSAEDADQPTQTVLLGDVRSLRFAYFGHLTNESRSAWHDRWADPTGLPALIRLDMSLALGQEAVRLTLFYAVRFSNNGV